MGGLEVGGEAEGLEVVGFGELRVWKVLGVRELRGVS